MPKDVSDADPTHFRASLPGEDGESVGSREAATPHVEAGSRERMRAQGRFLFRGSEKLYVRGVTYGTFRPGPDGEPFPAPGVVRNDFSLMASVGVNALRTYTVPPAWLLDEAGRHGLHVMAGLPWEQHVTFLDDRRRATGIVGQVRQGVRSCAGHPSLLCYSLGNEIPSSIVRWHGRRRVERFLHRLYEAAKDEDPDGLVTYVNYPTTEFLELPFLDLVSFNVFLESRDRLEGYLARLHNLAGDRPLVMTEIGLDARRHGEDAQAESLAWQLEASFASGCAGAFVFSWTDEWHRGGHEIRDWEFGITTRERKPKPALTAVRKAFDRVPVPPDPDPPRISVVVCTYNGGETVAETIERLLELRYPDLEVIVVIDGSTDETIRIVERHDEVRMIRTENRGLSAARNTGLEAATGEIIAYIDDDAYPDLHWLDYLAAAFRNGDFVGVGGPNLAPPEDPFLAQVVANAPGGPTYVLITDVEAEHIPGCNMAFRRDAMRAIGGFDPRFRTAGDDVDICWRLQGAGGRLGFHPGAVVWHHRRPSLRRYWKQQVGYGRAEALLEGKWPEKYNRAGHYAWQGRVYGPGLTRPLWLGRGRVYFGPWGSAPFQSLYQPAPGTLASLPLMPEWHFLVLLLAGVVVLGALWEPILLWGLPLLALVLGLPALQALRSAAEARIPERIRGRADRARFRLVTALLHGVQPVARLWGRLKLGLTPWRNRGVKGWVLPWPRNRRLWSESWRASSEWLAALDARLRAAGVPVLTGGAFDRWDLEVRAGLLGSARMVSAVEEHGEGRQLVRFRVWPRLRVGAAFPIAAVGGLAAVASGAAAWIAATAFAAGTAWLVMLLVRECGGAMAAIVSHLDAMEAEERLDGLPRVQAGRESPAGAGCAPPEMTHP